MAAPHQRMTAPADQGTESSPITLAGSLLPTNLQHGIQGEQQEITEEKKRKKKKRKRKRKKEIERIENDEMKKKEKRMKILCLWEDRVDASLSEQCVDDER